MTFIEKALMEEMVEAMRTAEEGTGMTNEELRAENVGLIEEVAKLQRRLSIREELRTRIAQLNTQLSIARAGLGKVSDQLFQVIDQRNSYIEDLVAECDHYTAKADALAIENTHLREALALADPVTERYRKSWDITSRALGRARQVLRGGVGYEDVDEDAGWGS